MFCALPGERALVGKRVRLVKLVYLSFYLSGLFLLSFEPV